MRRTCHRLLDLRPSTLGFVADVGPAKRHAWPPSCLGLLRPEWICPCSFVGFASAVFSRDQNVGPSRAARSRIAIRCRATRGDEDGLPFEVHRLSPVSINALIFVHYLGQGFAAGAIDRLAGVKPSRAWPPADSADRSACGPVVGACRPARHGLVVPGARRRSSRRAAVRSSVNWWDRRQRREHPPPRALADQPVASSVRCCTALCGEIRPSTVVDAVQHHVDVVHRRAGLAQRSCT